jgi:hypothetical protein
MANSAISHNKMNRAAPDESSTRCSFILSCFITYQGRKEIPVNGSYDFGRKSFSFSKGVASLTKVSITEKSLVGEDENTFTQRLLKKYANEEGTIEIVFKNGHPDYAIVTLVQISGRGLP